MMKTLFLSFQIAIFLLMAAPVQAGSVKGTRSKTVIRNRSLGRVNPNSSTEKYNQAVEKNKQTGFWSAPTGQIAQSPGSNNNNGGGAGGFFSSTTTNTNARAQSKGSGKAQSSDGARSSDGFSRATSGGKGGSSKKTSNNVDIARSSPSVMAGASALNTYDNKCDAAAAGAEYKTNSFVPVYYQYEVLTTQARDPFSLADVIDKAFQEFLAAWVVDCDTVNMEDDDFLATIAAAANNNNNNGNFGGRRGRQLKMLEEFVFPRFHRKLQMTLAPIVGTGVAEPDIVLLDGENPCQSLTASAILGQRCYKVVGSVNVYLDETMQVTPADIRSLALETLTVGVNYAATDFSLLDPDILGLFFVQGYETPPEELIKKNWEANQRSWYINQASPFATEPSKDRSGGAKFGIAFAILLLIALAALIAVYLYKNRAKLLGDKDEEWTSCCCCPMGNSPPKRSSPRKSSKKGSKKSRRSERYAEEEEDDIALYKRQQRRALGLEDDEDDDDLDEISFTETQATFRTVSSSPRSTRTRPVSSEVVTPRSNAYDQHDFRRTTTTRAPSYLETERNIVTPVSDWRGRSTYSRDGDFSDAPNAFAATPDDRIRVSLSKDTIRNSSARKNRSSAAAPLDEFSFSTRRYDVDDTVDL